jgi:hypothetical protein
MWAPFLGRANGQGFNLIQFRSIHLVEQVLEGIEVIGHLGQERFLDLQPYRSTQALDLCWG